MNRPAGSNHAGQLREGSEEKEQRGRGRDRKGKGEGEVKGGDGTLGQGGKGQGKGANREGKTQGLLFVFAHERQRDSGLDWIVVLGRVDCQGHMRPYLTEVEIIHMIKYGLQITYYMCSIITMEARITDYILLRIKDIGVWLRERESGRQTAEGREGERERERERQREREDLTHRHDPFQRAQGLSSLITLQITVAIPEGLFLREHR